MKNSRQIIGKKGEDEACRYLESLGHRILERNWRYSRLELDIISLLDRELHFVEVKSRTAPALAAPEINVGRAKQHRLTEAALAFMNSERRRGLPSGLEVYFDIITLLFDGPDFEIEYYPQAFIPTYA